MKKVIIIVCLIVFLIASIFMGLVIYDYILETKYVKRFTFMEIRDGTIIAENEESIYRIWTTRINVDKLKLEQGEEIDVYFDGLVDTMNPPIIRAGKIKKVKNVQKKEIFSWIFNGLVFRQ